MFTVQFVNSLAIITIEAQQKPDDQEVNIYNSHTVLNNDKNAHRITIYKKLRSDKSKQFKQEY